MSDNYPCSVCSEECHDNCIFCEIFLAGADGTLHDGLHDIHSYYATEVDANDLLRSIVLPEHWGTIKFDIPNNTQSLTSAILGVPDDVPMVTTSSMPDVVDLTQNTEQNVSDPSVLMVSETVEVTTTPQQQVSGLKLDNKGARGADDAKDTITKETVTNDTVTKDTEGASGGGDGPAVKQPESTEVKSAETGASGEADDNKTTKEDESLLRKLIHSKLVATKADLEVLQKDPNSPLYSVKTFEALYLKPELLKGVYEMGFNAPSKIQETALPSLLADPPTNMIAQSQSGTGKTAAFVLTMLSRVDATKPYPQCLCLAPTYELALQIGSVTEKMAKHMMDVRIGYAIRGERLARGAKTMDHILIGTPGTVSDWCYRNKCLDLHKITVFVLDEADVMIATQGHQDQSVRIQRGLSKTCQMLLFSATYDEEVMKFAQAVIPNNPIVIKLRREEESLDNIKQYYIDCNSQDHKFQAVSNIYGSISIGQSMIFCATRRTAHWLSEMMVKDGHAVALLSGDLEIAQRASIINRFRDGKEKVLITTNLSARGIDVEMVTVVINFDLPVTMDSRPDCETYLHRIGRTGRFGKAGLAINMVDSKRTYAIMKAIEKHFNRPIVRLDADDMEEIEKIST